MEKHGGLNARINYEMKPIVNIFPDLENLNHSAAEMFVRIGNEAINKGGRFTVALAGGSTPKSLYRLLSGEQFRNQIEWNNVFFFFGDERNVAPDDEESNFRTANENLFLPLQISGENIFRWRTELNNPEKTAEQYEKTIRSFFNLSENEFPRFDLILLGMGDDGHTASLFPLTRALSETEKIAATNEVEKLSTVRLTLTFPALNNAENIIFFVAGANKAETLQAVLEGDSQPEKYPSQMIKPLNGGIYWFIDAGAASRLNKI